MKVILKKDKISSHFFEGKFYDTGRELDLSFSEIFRLTRITQLDAGYESVPYEPSLWKDRKFINFSGDIDTQSGFGNVSYYLIKESSQALQIAAAGKTYGVADRAILVTKNRELEQAGVMVWHEQPKEQWEHSPFAKNIAIIPWETTLVPPSWVARINKFDALFTCCNENIKAFRNSGIKIPIELIHWGVDPFKFYPLKREENEIFTFGTMGALSHRKGTDILVAAFQEEFPTEKDVKLICKTSYNTCLFNVQDKRIEVQMTPVDHEELIVNFFKRIDCFVFPTRGEGFGLTPLEAMATGIPAIVTDWGGPVEYMVPEVGWTIDYDIVPAKNFSEQVYKEPCGNWTEPKKEHLKKLMRYAYEHQQEVREKGNAAAKYVQENWLWQDKIKMFHQALDKYL